MGDFDSAGITEEEKVEAWRLKVLLDAGYPLLIAERIAPRHEGPDAIDLHQAVQLVDAGCRPETAVEILS